jgi:hypothetical protein
MGIVSDVIGGLTGQTAADAATASGQTILQGTREGIAATERATKQGLGFLQPFAGIGQQGIEQAGFLTDPQAQFDFLQSNPLFQAALNQANTQTQNLAAARGRLSAGDTLQQLSQNVLLSASPLIAEQKRSIADLLNVGTGIAQSQANTAINQGSNVANLLTGGAQAVAAGQVGAANAQQQAIQNLVSGGATIAGAFSDKRLKTNIKKVGETSGYNIYTWTWNKIAESLGLSGDSRGVLANEVILTNPEAVSDKDGFLRVNYQMIGVPHGD